MFWYDPLNPDAPPITIGVYDPNLVTGVIGDAINAGIFKGQLPMTPGYLVPAPGSTNNFIYVNPENGAQVDVAQALTAAGLDSNYYLNLMNAGVYTPDTNGALVNQVTGVPINTNQLLGNLGLDYNYFNNLMGTPGGLQFEIAPGTSIPGKITGTDDADFLNGTWRQDTITGLGGNDTIYGYEDNDIISGNKGDDILHAGAGNDSLNGGTGNDTMFGDIGDDTYFVDSVRDEITESSDQGNDTVITSVSYNLSDNVENMLATGKENLFLKGNSLSNIIAGNAGNTNISGLDGDDLLIGQDGDDTLTGDQGNDTLIGGSGNDSYCNYDSINFGHDTISDLGGNDSLDLNKYDISKTTFIAVDTNGDNILDGLLIKLPETSCDITIQDYFGATTQTLGTGEIENIHFSNYTDADFAYISNNLAQ